MAGTVHLKLVVLALAMTWIHCRTDAKRSKFPVDRSYQLSPVAVVNGAQGLQYYSTGPVYSGVHSVPAVFLPGKIGLEHVGLQSAGTNPVLTNFVLPSNAIKQPEYYESSTPSYFNPISSPVHQISQHESHHSHYPTHKPKIRSHSPVYKRPSSGYNSLHSHSTGPKQTVGLSGYQNHKTSFSVHPSIDLTDHSHQPTSSSSYLSTVPPPQASTYGPPKPIDFPYKPRPSSHPPGYHRHKSHGHSHVHRHPYRGPKPIRVYSHVHNGHIHNHYLPPSHSTPLYKSQLYTPKPTPPTFVKPSVPAYLPPSPGTPPSQDFGSFSGENTQPQSIPESPYNFHAHHRPESTNQIRFPDNSLDNDKPSFYQPPSISNFEEPRKPGLTEAIIREPGVINNHDASLPLKIPTQKPNHFQVKEILKNADIHYVDANDQSQNNEQTEAYQQVPAQYNPPQYNHQGVVQYQDSQIFDPSQPTYQTYSIQSNQPNYETNQGFTNQADYYDSREPSNSNFLTPSDYQYPNNHLQSEQELGTSETIKIPVAIFKGIPSTNGPGMFAIPLKRSDESVAEVSDKSADFTPSRLSSDWIPVTGNRVASAPSVPEKDESAELEKFGDKYFSDLIKNRSKKDESSQRISSGNRVITSNVGDIISGKIPDEYAPFQKSSNDKSNIRTIDIKGGRDSDIVTGKISFGGNSPPESNRRKGSVIDDFTGSNESTKFGDTSNLVVSSVIKFS